MRHMKPDAAIAEAIDNLKRAVYWLKTFRECRDNEDLPYSAEKAICIARELFSQFGHDNRYPPPATPVLSVEK